MTLLLDTHVLLWWLAEDDRLTPTMREAIADWRSRDLTADRRSTDYDVRTLT